MSSRPSPLYDRLAADGDGLFDRIESGQQQGEIAAFYEGSWNGILKWINKDPERRRKYEIARQRSADADVEEAARVLREANHKDKSTAEVSAAKNLASFLQWRAARRDREQYGDTPQVQINNNLNLGELHLDALRKVGSMNHLPKTPDALPAELVDEDDDG